MIDRAVVQRWLDAYVRAWETYDAAAIADLFTADATYAWHPYDDAQEVVRGRDAIVKAWLDDRDTPGRYRAQYAPLAIDGEVVITKGRSQYFDAEGRLEREFHNMWELTFGADGRCATFVEWFMETPKRKLPGAG
jgi:ketosteroid isomerase-like protein